MSGRPDNSWGFIMKLDRSLVMFHPETFRGAQVTGKV